MIRRLLVASVAAVSAPGCATLYPTAADGPQRALVRDAVTGTPVAAAEVTYEFRCYGPPAKVRRNERGQIELEPQLERQPTDEGVAPRLPGEDVAAVQRIQKPGDFAHGLTTIRRSGARQPLWNSCCLGLQRRINHTGRETASPELDGALTANLARDREPTPAHGGIQDSRRLKGAHP